jgi:hypothetical protein
MNSLRFFEKDARGGSGMSDFGTAAFIYQFRVLVSDWEVKERGGSV